MNQNSRSGAGSKTIALEIRNLPEHDAVRFCDESHLKKIQIFASDIVELTDIVTEYGLPDYPIVFCKIPFMKACVYLEGDYSYNLMFIDSSKTKTEESLRESYLHEAAHLLSDGQDHDFAFAIVYNTFRLKIGLEISNEDYDYRACGIEGLELSETKELCKKCSEIILNSNMPSIQLLENMKFFLSNDHYMAFGDNNLDDILESFICDVQFISNEYLNRK